MKEYLEAGEIVTTHGVMGEMKLYPWCDGAQFIAKLPRLFFGKEGAYKELKILSVREQKGMALVKLEGVSSIDDTRAYIRKVAYFKRSDAQLPKGRYFIADMIGCEVVDAETGKVYGKITDVTHPAASDIYEIETPNGEKVLFPAVKEFVAHIAPEDGVVKINPIKGMFDGGEVNGDEN
ncbi:MAG: 16S rRNA processing protein RimM [Clostridia bacterium]|nr:16S rRNA processing protein RimM [Clostridia bacterium]NLS84950.1 16S rRNA processing protein RimM [Oscillospiraceae bacterium]